MHRTVYLLLFIFLLYGCGPAPTRQMDEVQVDPENQAIIYLNNNNYQAAAVEYLRLAREDRQKHIYYNIKAIQAFIEAKQITDAEKIFQSIKPDKLSGVQKAELVIIEARLALAKGNIAEGLSVLQKIELPPDPSGKLMHDYHLTRAMLFEQNTQNLLAANERVMLGRYLDKQDRLENNHQQIWDLVNKATPDEINAFRSSASEIMAGWLELALIGKTITDNNIISAIELWGQRYPGHPATNRIIPGILEIISRLDLIPHQIALLLPFDSKYREVSNAIRDGFLAAWYSMDGDKPFLKIYDTSLAEIDTVYQTAIIDGAEYIIGPLKKDAIEKLLMRGEFPVKTLVLNKTEVTHSSQQDTYPPNPAVIQYGLTPEEEAVQLAERAWFDGMVNTIVITSATQTGNRTFNSFKNRWDQLGGRILQHISLPPDTEEFSEPIKQLLNVDKSEQREKLLQSRLSRKLHAEPRRRQDIDFFLMVVDPVTGRQIIPQLKFYRAGDIPVYSTSGIFTGILNPGADKDMDRVIFTDIPWVVDPGHVYSEIQRLLEETKNQSRSAYRRLYAFGIDAFQIMMNHGRLASKDDFLQGETGRLKLGKDGRIIRKLTFATFRDGAPILLDNY